LCVFNRELLIIDMTGHTGFGEEEEIVANGASAVLKKPTSLRELLDMIEGLFQN
jgi:hypothetical protein